MQKKYCLLILAFAFTLGTIVASLPPVKAQEQVRFYIFPTIIPNASVGSLVVVEVWIESPIIWDNTPQGLVGYSLSVRGDPRALEPVGAGKIPAMGGFLEDFLLRFFYDPIYWTQMVPPLEMDPVTCTFFDVSEYIWNYETLGVGAGGGPIKLMRFIFRSRSIVIPSVIDLFGRSITEISATYITADGVDHFVDVMDDGYYIAETPDTVMFDSSEGYNPADPMFSDWHELWSDYSDDWTLASYIDNSDGVFSVSDEIDMDNIDTGEHYDFHVDWLNPTPVADDGKTDMIVTIKPPPVPEFPIGVGLMMALAPAIPIVYLWRRHKKTPSLYVSNSSLGRAQPPGLIEICSKSLNPLLQLH